MFKKKKLIALISSLAVFTIAATVLSTTAWLVGTPMIETEIDSNIKNIAGYFDSNVADPVTGETVGNGEGTDANPFVISRPEHLNNLMRLYNDSDAYTILSGKVFELGKVLDTSGNKKVYKYVNGEEVKNEYSTELDMSGFANTFRPIGISGERQFTSILKGNGLTISDLTVSRGSHNASEFDAYGFLGHAAQTSRVENLNFNNLVIKASTSDKFSGFYAGYADTEESFMSCKVRSGSIENNTSKLKTNYGYFGTVGNKSATASGTANHVSLNASDITNSDRNPFADYKYDHLVTRPSYDSEDKSFPTDTDGKPIPFSNAVSEDGLLKEGYSLSTTGHVVSKTRPVFYGTSASDLENVPSTAEYVDEAPGKSSDSGEYYYKDENGYHYAEVNLQNSKEGYYNTFILSTIYSDTIHYLYLDTNDGYLKITQTAPGTYGNTPNYYFSLTKDGTAEFGISEITSGQLLQYNLYSPHYAKYAYQNGNYLHFDFKTNERPNPYRISFKAGTDKEWFGGISIGGDLKINVNGSNSYYFAFTTSNAQTPIFNRNKGVTRAAGDVYKTALFGISYNSVKTNGYSNSWSATNNGFTVNITNANNFNNEWSYIRMGSKSGDSTGTITTNSSIDKKISSVKLTIDSITVGNISSITLTTGTTISCNNGHSYTFTKAIGTQTITIPTDEQSTNLYYKITVVCTKSGNNGTIQISKVEYVEGASNVPVTGVSVSPSSCGLSIGGTQQLKETVSPSNATNKAVSWGSSNTGVATVDSTGKVTAVSAGSATITVTTVDGSKQATCAVTVYAKPTINSMNIKTVPTKYYYTKDVDTTINTQGLVVSANVTVLGSTSTVDLTTNDYYVKNTPSLSTVGVKTVVLGNDTQGQYKNPTRGSVEASFDIEVVNPASITLSGSDSITHYASMNIACSTADLNGNITWSLSDSSKVSISNATNNGITITADKAAYDTNIILYASGKNLAGHETIVSKTIRVNPLPVASVSFTGAVASGITLTEGDTYGALTSYLSFTSSDGIHQPDNKGVSFSLTDKSSLTFATIDSSTGEITTSGSGTANIVVTTADGGYTDSIPLEVQAMASDPVITEDSENIYELFKGEEANFYGYCEYTTTISWDLISPTGVVTHPEDLSDPLDGFVMVAFTPSEQGVYTLVCNPSNSVVEGEPVEFKYYVLDLDNLTVSGATSAFNVGDTFNFNNINVVANYSDGTNSGNHERHINVTSSIQASNITPPSSLVTGGICTTAGTGSVTVNYEDSNHLSGTGTYSITVSNVNLTEFTHTISGNGMASKPGLTSLVLLVGDTKTITLSNPQPNNATNPQYTYSSSNISSVSLSQSTGLTTTITAESVGTSVITISGLATGQTTPVTHTINVEVKQSISSSSNYEGPIPYIGDADVDYYDMYWSPENDGNYEKLNPNDERPTFFDVGGVLYVCVGEYSAGESNWSDYQLVTNVNQIEGGDKIIFLNSSKSATTYTLSNPKPANAYIDNEYSEMKNGDNMEYALNGSDTFTIENNSIPYATVDNNECWCMQFEVEERDDDAFDLYFDWYENYDYDTYGEYVDSYYFGTATSNNTMSFLASSGNRTGIVFDSIDSDGCARMRQKNRGSQEFILINQTRHTTGAFGVYTPNQGDRQYALPRIFVSKYVEQPPVGNIDFIGDNVINSESVNPITESNTSNARIDIIGSDIGGGVTLSEEYIGIQSKNNGASFAAAKTSGAFNPVQDGLGNSLIVYVPKNGTNNDKGTLHIESDLSNRPVFVNSGGSLTLAENFFTENSGVTDWYISLNSNNIDELAYCKITENGNYSTSASTFAYYVLVLTAPNKNPRNVGKPIQIGNIEWFRNNGVIGCNNYFDATNSSVPFTFAVESSTTISKIQISLNETNGNEFNVVIDRKSAGTMECGFVNYKCDLNCIRVSSDSGLNYTPLVAAVSKYSIS